MQSGDNGRVWKRLLPPLLILALASIAYVNAGHRELFFDSADDNIVNPRQSQGVLAAVRNYLNGKDTHECAVSYITFALNYSLNTRLGLDGYDLRGFVVFNVLVHAVNACLVYLLVRACCAGGPPLDVDPAGGRDDLRRAPPAGQQRGVHHSAPRVDGVDVLFIGVLAYLRARGGDGRHRGRPLRMELAANSGGGDRYRSAGS